MSQSLRANLSAKPLVVWCLAALFYFYENTIQVSQSVMIDALMSDLKTNANQLSILSSLYFWGYALIQIPVGLIIDRHGIKKPLVIAVLACAAGAIMFSRVHDIYFAGLSRFIIGLGSAFAALSALQIAALYFSKEKFASLTGFLLTIGMSGQIFGEAPLNLLVHHYGWRHSMLNIGLLGFLIFLLVIYFVPNSRSKHETSNLGNMKKDLIVVASQPQPWLVGLYGMLMFTPFLILAGFWGVPFLIHACHYSQQQAANICSFLPLGFAIGAPVIGFLSDTYKSRKVPLVISSITQAALLSCLILIPKISALEHSILMFCIGFSCSGFLPSFSVIKEITSHQIRGASLGFMNTFNMFGVIIFMPIIGFLLDKTWNHVSIDGHPVYNLYSYQTSLGLLPLLVLVAFFVALFIRESFGQD